MSDKTAALLYDTEPGQHINAAIEGAIALSASAARPVEFTHNGVTLRVTKDSNLQDVFHSWETELTASTEARRNSPDGIAAAKAHREQGERYQRNANELLELLTPGMTEAGLVAWVGAFAMYSDDTRVQYDKQRVVDILQAAGYHAGECCVDAYIPAAPSIFARWLIGQALSGLTGEVGAIHPIAHKFAEDYKQMCAKAGKAEAS